MRGSGCQEKKNGIGVRIYRRFHERVHFEGAGRQLFERKVKEIRQHYVVMYNPNHGTV